MATVTVRLSLKKGAANAARIGLPPISHDF